VIGDHSTTSGRWVAIQRNPTSGRGRRLPLLDFIRALREYGITPRLYSSRERLDAAVRDPARRASLHCLVAAGGDGTILDLVNRHPDIPVGVMPLGTENLLSKHFAIPRTGRGAAAVIAEGRVQPLDVGRIGERRFLIMASAGFDADVIHRAAAARSGTITRSHYLRPIWNSVRQFRHPVIRVFLDDDPEPVVGRLIVVANLPNYALRLRIAPDAQGNDGLFDVCVFQGGSTFQMLRYLSMVALRRHTALSDVIIRRARRVLLDPEYDVPVQVDGDPAGVAPFVTEGVTECAIDIEPAAAQLLVPVNWGIVPCPKLESFRSTATAAEADSHSW